MQYMILWVETTITNNHEKLTQTMMQLMLTWFETEIPNNQEKPT